MIKKFRVSKKSTIIFKINIVKITDKYPKLKNTYLSLNLSKNCYKKIKEIYKENASELK